MALAVLLTFLLTPVVTTSAMAWAGPHGRLTVTVAAFVLLELAGWGLTWQVAGVLDELQRTEENALQRVRDIEASRGGSVEKLQRQSRTSRKRSTRTPPRRPPCRRWW